MTQWIEKRVDALKAGDQTPWYRVLREPERESDGLMRVFVHHNRETPESRQYVRGNPHDVVPVEVRP